MNARPRIQLPVTTGDRVIQWLGIWCIAGCWIVAGVAFARLPDTIPTHFNLHGQADAYGSKTTILLLPIVATLLFALLSWIGRCPHWFNYPVTITPGNASRQYMLATKMLRYLRLALAFIFFIIITYTYLLGAGYKVNIGSWLVPVILVCTMAPTAYFVVKAVRSEKRL